MNTVTLPENAGLTDRLRVHWEEWRRHAIFKDPISVAALVAAAGLALVTLAVLIIKVHPVDYKVGVHYMNLVGFDKLGSWFEVYRFAAFSIIITIVNGSLAAKSFQRNRLVSFFLLLGAVVVNLLCLVIALAFAEIV